MPMSSENSTAGYLQKKDLKKNTGSIFKSEAKTDKGGECNEEKPHQKIPEFTKDEVQTAINEPKKGKASDNNGIRAAPRKHGEEYAFK